MSSSVVWPSLLVLSGKEEEKTVFYVAPERMSPLQKHCAYFDRDDDGILLPWETFVAFRLLGYNLFLSLFGTAVIHLFFSYWTLDTWVPDPLFPILIKNVDRLKHGSDSEIYNHDGSLKQLTDPVLNLLAIHDREGKGGLSLWDLTRMTQKNWECMDWFGWWAAKLEWFYLWVLAQKNGVVDWDAVRLQYDDSLFKQVETQQQQQQQEAQKAKVQ